MEIREYRSRDWESVWNLWQLCRLPLPPGCRAKAAQACCASPDLFLIADAGGAILGSAVGTWDGERGWICSVVVDPRVRRMGVARRLIQELESRLRQKGAAYLLTQVPGENLDARMVFEAAGFEPRSDLILMGKPLK